MNPICEAIRQAIEQSGLTQAEIALCAGVKPSQVSDWARGKEPKLDGIAALERGLRVPRGFLLRAAGYVEQVVTIEDLLANDIALTTGYRQLVLETYESAKRLSMSERGDDDDDDNNATTSATRRRR